MEQYGEVEYKEPVQSGNLNVKADGDEWAWSLDYPAVSAQASGKCKTKMEALSLGQSVMEVFGQAAHGRRVREPGVRGPEGPK